MPRRTWEPLRRAFCDRVGEQVVFEAEVIFPAEILPDQPPRVLGHRCSLGLTCNQFDRPSCVWSGTQPGYDPLR